MHQENNSYMPRIVLTSATVLAFAMWSPMFSVPPVAHILKEQLSVTYAQISLLYIAPIMMIVAVSIPSGVIADKIGLRKTVGIGAIIIAIGSILRSIATDYSSLLAFTFIYGTGLSLVFTNLPKLVSACVPREKAGMAMGVITAGIAVGFAMALAISVPVLLPITGTVNGVFLVWGISPIVAAILWWVVIKEPAKESIGSKTTSNYTAPLRHVLRNKSLWLISILFMLHNLFIYTWTGWAPLLMIQKGASPDLAGLITSVTIWIGLPTVLLMPRLSYKLGLRKPFLWASGIILTLAAWSAIKVTLPTSWILMALVGVAIFTRFPMLLALPVEIMPQEHVGTASGVVLSIGYTGAIIGPYVGGRILDLTGSLDLSLLVLVGISIATVGIVFSIPETGQKAQ